MGKSGSKLAPPVRERVLRMVLDQERGYASRRANVVSFAEKISCEPQAHELVEKVKIDSGKCAGVPIQIAQNVKALERKFCELSRPKRFCVWRRHFAQAERD